MEHNRKLFFTKKFKIVRGCGIDGFWARVIVSSSPIVLDQIAFDLNEGNYLNKTSSELYLYMISEWKRLMGNKRMDFFQAEWERVNA